MSNNLDNCEEINFNDLDQKIVCQKCGKEINKYSQFLHNTICNLKNDVDFKFKHEVTSINQSEQQNNNKDETGTTQKSDIDDYIKYYEEKIRKMREGNIYQKESELNNEENKTSDKENEQPKKLYDQVNDSSENDDENENSDEEINNKSHEKITKLEEIIKEKENDLNSQRELPNLITNRTDSNPYDMKKPSSQENNISGKSAEALEDSFETDFNKEIVDEIALGKDEFFVKTNVQNEIEETKQEIKHKYTFKETNFSKKSHNNSFDEKNKDCKHTINVISKNEIIENKVESEEIPVNNFEKPTSKNKIGISINNMDLSKDISMKTPQQKKAKNFKAIPTNNNNSTPKKQPIISTEFLEKIEKTENINNEESKKQMEELLTIESSLKLDQRLIHEKWQIRKNAFKEVANILEFLFNEHFKDYDPNEDNELNQAFDTFSPWMLYFLTDNNITTLAEGLQTFFIFMKLCEKYRQKALFLFFDELEKIISFNKNNILDICEKIIEIFLKDKKLKNFSVNELLKKMIVKNNKLSSFATDIIVKNLGEFNETYIKLIFEKGILHYSNTESKNIERKKILSRVIVEIYKKLFDNLDAIKKNLNINSEVAKDLEKIFKKVDKENEVFKLYKVDETENLKRSQLQSQIPSNSKPDIVKTDDVDLLTILPDNFKDFTYITQINKKVEILKNLNNKLSQVKTLAIKDYKTFYDILDYAISDSNILVHLEAIKILTNVCTLLQMHINYSKLKVLLYSCFDKFSDNKTNVKNQLFILFDTILLNFCMQIENFIDFTLQFVTKQKNTNVKQNILEYIKSLFDENTKDESRNIKINGLLNNMDDGNLINLIKQVADIIKNENSPMIKDTCTDIIIIVKSRINDQTVVEKYLDNLPRHRKQLLSQDYYSEKSGKLVNFSKEPQIRSQKSKANIYNNSRKELNMSVNKSEKPKSRAESKSVEKKNNLNNTLQEKLKSKVKENLKNKVNLPKFNSKKALNTTNQEESSNNINNIKVINYKEDNRRQMSSTNKVMSTSIKDKNKIDQQNETNKIVESYPKKNSKLTIELPKRENEINNFNNESSLKMRIDPVIEHISSLQPLKINEYAKKLIMDFLIFVKKATSKQSGEDLSSHFIVIIQILDKLFEKIDKSNSNEIIIQSTKIIIVSPCFLRENQNYFEEIIEKLRLTLNNEERFFNIVIGVLEKFNNTSTSSTFLKNIDPKVSFIAVFNYFIKSKFDEIVLNALKGIIDNCQFLNNQEKTDFKNKIDLIVNSSDEKDNEEEAFDSCDEDNNSTERNKIEFESSLLREKININTYNKEEKFEIPKNNNYLTKSRKSEKSDEEYNKVLTNSDLDKEKFEADKEEISIIKKRSHSPDLISDEDKLQKNLQIKKNDWIEKYREEKKTHIETLGNLEKTSKDYMIQINENEKLKEKLNLLIKQNQQLMHGIEKFSEKKEKAIPKTSIETTNSEQSIQKDSTTTKYDSEISNLKALLNDKCKSLEINIKQVEEKLGNNAINVQTTNEVKSISSAKNNEKTQENSDFKLFKPIKSLENVQDEVDNLPNIKSIHNLSNDPIQKPDFTTLILKIPSQLLDSDMNVSLYVKLESIYSKIETEDRVNFIDQIKELVESNELMNSASFNSLMLFFEFLVNLLEIKNGYKYTLTQKDLHRSMIFKVQENIENLIKRQKNLTNVYIFQLYMLKKYLPKDFKIQIERDSLIYIKILTHLLKSSNETIMKSCSEVFILDVLKETNDLFIKFPSQNLMYGLPNLEDLDKVYSQLRVMVDIMVPKNNTKTQLFIKAVKQQGIYCPIFIQYLENLV